MGMVFSVKAILTKSFIFVAFAVLWQAFRALHVTVGLYGPLVTWFVSFWSCLFINILGYDFNRYKIKN